MRVYRWLLLTLVLTLPMALAQSARESTLVIGADLGDLITLDPGVSYEFSGSLIIDNLYETLVRFEGDDLTEVRARAAAAARYLADGVVDEAFAFTPHAIAQEH